MEHKTKIFENVQFKLFIIFKIIQLNFNQGESAIIDGRKSRSKSESKN